MVEIEEISEDAKKEDEKPPPPKGFKYKKTKKDLPSVSHLLAHGSDESRGKPKTFWGECWYPIFIAVCFAISLLIFHYAPHEKSVQPKGKFAMQYKRSQQQQQRQQQMDMGKAVPLPPTINEEEVIKPQQEEVKPQQGSAGSDSGPDGEL